MAAVFLGASPAHPLIVYSAPAGVRPAGPDSLHPAQGILPNGRISAPAGTTIPVGTDPAMLALTPNGHFAIISNNDDRVGGAPVQPAPLAAGASLAVVDAVGMRLKSVFQDPGMSFSGGVAALNDPAAPGRTLVLASDAVHGVVLVFDLDSTGTLSAESQPISLAAQAFPAGIAVTPDGRTAYVADRRGNAVYAIDVAQRRTTATLPAGYGTEYVAAAHGRVVATSGSAGTFRTVTPPASRPPFGAPPFDASRSMVSSVFVSGADGVLGTDPYRVPMDQPPDGTQVVGGDAPGAVAISRDGSTAYVALSNVDRVAVLALDGQPRVVRGLDLRLFPDAPYGAQPSALALSRDGKRLFVALAGLDSVAVLDARSPSRYRYGLVPTGWFPTALAVSPNGRYLYVVGAKGVDGWGVLSRVDLKHTSLIRATMNTLRYARVAAVAHFNAVVPALRSARRSDVIQHVVYVGVDPQTYDVAFGADATTGPNLHALATAYASADNFYAADRDRDVARAFSYSGSATLATELSAPIGLSRVPPGAGPDDPDGYARFGSLFDAAFARRVDVSRLRRTLSANRIRCCRLPSGRSGAARPGQQRRSHLCDGDGSAQTRRRIRARHAALRRGRTDAVVRLRAARRSAGFFARGRRSRARADRAVFVDDASVELDGRLHRPRRRGRSRPRQPVTQLLPGRFAGGEACVRRTCQPFRGQRSQNRRRALGNQPAGAQRLARDRYVRLFRGCARPAAVHRDTVEVEECQSAGLRRTAAGKLRTYDDCTGGAFRTAIGRVAGRDDAGRVAGRAGSGNGAGQADPSRAGCVDIARDRTA